MAFEADSDALLFDFVDIILSRLIEKGKATPLSKKLTFLSLGMARTKTPVHV